MLSEFKAALTSEQEDEIFSLGTDWSKCKHPLKIDVSGESLTL